MTFIKGHPQYNSGRTYFKKGEHISLKTEFKKGMIPASFKTVGASRKALDAWAKSRIEKPTKCEMCGSIKPLEMSNKSHEYRRDVSDWQWICKICHRNYDGNSYKAWVTRRANAQNFCR